MIGDRHVAGGEDDERSCLLALARRTENQRDLAELTRLLEDSGSARRALTRLSYGQLSLLCDQELAEAGHDLRLYQAAGVTMISVLDDCYPENLKHARSRPPFLFIRGELRPSDRRAVAVIGTRTPSADGLRLAHEVAGALARNGLTVVSGLALGIDAAAHQAALAERRRTVAVVGTGLFHTYPPEHAELERRVAEAGAVVSQFLPEKPPSRQTFPLRNAVMSGVAVATVIVEAGPTSGARIQARSSLAQRRPLFITPAVAEQEWASALSPASLIGVFENAEQLTSMVLDVTGCTEA